MGMKECTTIIFISVSFFVTFSLPFRFHQGEKTSIEKEIPKKRGKLAGLHCLFLQKKARATMYSYRSFCLFLLSFLLNFMVANFLISGKLSGFGQQRASILLGGGKSYLGPKKFLFLFFFSFLVFLLVGFTSFLLL